ncbi:ATP-dependent RNA helicase, partial [Kickxella alabastrina]
MPSKKTPRHQSQKQQQRQLLASFDVKRRKTITPVKKIKNPVVEAANEQWADMTMNPPPMPAANKPAAFGGAPSPSTQESKKRPQQHQSEPASSAPASAKKTKRTKPKKSAPQQAAEESSTEGEEGEWDWKDVAMPTYIPGADNDIGGMVSLQEIDGVNCAWEDDEETGGRTLKFHKARKAGKPAQKSDAKQAKRTVPLARITSTRDDSDEEIDNFYDTVDWDSFVAVDDYSEQKAETGELVSIGKLMREAESELAGANVATDADEGQSDDDLVGLSGSEIEEAEEEEEDEEEEIGEDEIGEDEDEDEDAMQVDEVEIEDDEEKDDTKAAGFEDDVEDPDVDVSAWDAFGVHPLLQRALKHLGFNTPSEIQSKTLYHSMTGRDIIGAAETGSGKTLAFGIPMLQHISENPGKWTAPTGLVLTPTRELAIQVKNHLKAMARFSRARVVVIVGGMSQPKQERQLNTCPDIIIATPGRFWDLVSTNDVYLDQLRAIKFLAIDEADRMLEPGHFSELKDIFKALNETALQETERRRQTFVFSATLLKDMQLNKRKLSPKAMKRMQGKPESGTMEDLIGRVGFYDKQPLFIDVTRGDSTAKTLVETRIDCMASEKDHYLYYFLMRYPGRTLVFVNSIDSIRRMLPMLRLLQINVFGLHAQMEQRQRLKNVDRFRDTENAVMVASDVAARGLDIPQVDYVIHYQLPRSGDLYVHRSGRTARASNEGLAVMMVSPEERKLYYKMCAKLDKDISPFPIDLDLIGRLKPRV